MRTLENSQDFLLRKRQRVHFKKICLSADPWFNVFALSPARLITMVLLGSAKTVFIILSGFTWTKSRKVALLHVAKREKIFYVVIYKGCRTVERRFTSSVNVCSQIMNLILHSIASKNSQKTFRSIAIFCFL